jgi:hypothetical protein
MSRRLAAASILVFFAFAGPARAAIPNADNPKAYTQHDHARGKLDFGKRTLSGAYNTVGKRDAKWDAAATKFLDAMAVHFAYSGLDAVYHTVDTLSYDALLALGKTAIDAGCDDPLVLYCYGNILHVSGRLPKAKPVLEKAAAGLAESRYHPYRINAALRRALTVMSPQTDAALMIKYKRLAAEQGLAAVARKADPKDLRYLLEAGDTEFEAAPLGDKLAFCKALEKSKDADPWLTNYYYGRYEVTAAWAARGAGWAQNVGEKGWEGFFEHLAKARTYLVKAHALRPDLPEAATQMIAVAMGAGEQLNEQTRDWFDKAVKAQLDYMPAYNSYEWSIYPRWGGSHRQMIQFGIECVQTGRHDTMVPFNLMTVLYKVDADSTHDLSVLTDPEVRNATRALFAGEIKNAKTPEQKRSIASYQIALCWRSAQYREAADLLDKIEDKLDPAQIGRFGGTAPEVVSQIRAMNTTHARTIAEAEREVAEGELNSAILALLNVAQKLDRSHPGQLYLRGRAKGLEFIQEFWGGDWVSLRPEEGLSPWSTVQGEWKFDDEGALVGTADANGRALVTLRTAEFGSHFDLKATIEQGDPEKPATAMLIPQYWGQPRAPMAGLNPTGQSAFATSGGEPREAKHPIKGGETITLKVRGDRFDVFVDGKSLIVGYPLDPRTPQRGVHIALGVYKPANGGATAKFRDIQVKRIAPPKDP